jgi:hypothetical protein
VRVILVVLWIALGAAQITAYLAGINLWLGLGTPLGLIVFFGTVWVPFGSLIDAILSFYGAYAAWHWTWWQAALLAFPFAIVGIMLNGASAIVHLFGRRSNDLHFRQ